MSLNVLLISDEILKERTGVHGNLDPKLIYPDIKIAQDMYILPIVGSALYTKLQTAVNARSWTGLDAYKNLLDNYIIDALLYYTMAELPTSLGYQFWNKGIVRKLGQDTELPSMSDLVDISNKYRTRAEWYAERLKRFLIANPNTYPEYLAAGTGVDTIWPNKNTFTSPIYLGGEDQYCNLGGFVPNKPYSDG